MADSRLATWKYNHEYPNRRRLGPVLLVLVLCVGLGTLAVGAVDVLFGAEPVDTVETMLGTLAAATVGALVLLLILAVQRKCVSVGPRYLICGSQIIYFASVTGAVLDTRAGRLHLATASGQQFVLEQRRFPTGARKPHKIALNTSAKFTKVADRILTRVRQAAPDAVINVVQG